MDVQARLGIAIGDARVRPARPEEAVGGALPQAVVEPATPEEVAEVLRAASVDDIALVVRGGGSKIDWGPATRRCDAILSTRALDRVIEYEPGDMTCVVEAGLRLDALQRDLGGNPTHRQALMLDPPGADGTIGGIVATNAAGPRRTRYGTPRDLLLGVRYVTGDGLSAHAGGKVVKNVAGYDVAKVLSGSLGTLAVITETAWKLHPVPEAARTVVVELTDADALDRACAALRRAPIVPTAVEAVWPDGLLMVRIESTTAGADAQATQVVDLLGSGARILADAEGDQLLDDLRDRSLDGDAPAVAVGVLPSDLAGLARAVADAESRLTARALLVAGEIHLPDADPERLRALVTRILDLGGTVQPRRVPAPLQELVSGPQDPGALLVSSALKRELDPAGILAPGRDPAGVA